MPTIRKTTTGESYIHQHGTVSGNGTIDVDADTAEYLTDDGDYEYVEAGGESEADPEPETEGYLRDAPVEVQVEEGVCPWCPPDDRYEGDHVGQHASSAHSDEWAEYSGDE